MPFTPIVGQALRTDPPFECGRKPGAVHWKKSTSADGAGNQPGLQSRQDSSHIHSGIGTTVTQQLSNDS